MNLLTQRDLIDIQVSHSLAGFDYKLPDFNGEQAVITNVQRDEIGSFVAALHCRKEAEAYLFVDPNASTRARWKAIQALDRECCPILRINGFDQVVVWIPKSIEMGFAHALVELGFRKMRAEFSPWSKEI